MIVSFRHRTNTISETNEINDKSCYAALQKWYNTTFYNHREPVSLKLIERVLARYASEKPLSLKGKTEEDKAFSILKWLSFEGKIWNFKIERRS